MIQLQHLKCKCGLRFTENVVGNDEYLSIQTVERMFGHFMKRGHSPLVKRFMWGIKEPELDEGYYP